jgi:hypothetical protein
MTSPDPDEASEVADAPQGSSDATLDYSSPGPAHASVANAPAGRLDWAVIAIRMLALYCWVLSVVPALMMIPVLVEENRFLSVGDRLRAFAPYAIYIGTGIVLWAMARVLARWMVSDVPPVGMAHRSRVSVAQAHAMAFSIVGAVLVVYSLRNLGSAIGLSSLVRRTGSDSGDDSSYSAHYFIQFAIEAGAGVALFLGARGLANLWHRLTATRYGATNHEM